MTYKPMQNFKCPRCGADKVTIDHNGFVVSHGRGMFGCTASGTNVRTKP